MSARLLSFLSMIQDAIKRREPNCPEGVRMINYQKNIARFTMKDGGAVQVQSFLMDEGKSAIKVVLYWGGIPSPAIQSVYPNGEDFDYGRAAGRIAQLWVDGPIAAGISFGGESDAGPALSKLSPIS